MDFTTITRNNAADLCCLSDDEASGKLNMHVGSLDWNMPAGLGPRAIRTWLGKTHWYQRIDLDPIYPIFEALQIIAGTPSVRYINTITVHYRLGTHEEAKQIACIPGYARIAEYVRFIRASDGKLINKLLEDELYWREYCAKKHKTLIEHCVEHPKKNLEDRVIKVLSWQMRILGWDTEDNRFLNLARKVWKKKSEAPVWFHSKVFDVKVTPDKSSHKFWYRNY